MRIICWLLKQHQSPNHVTWCDLEDMHKKDWKQQSSRKKSTIYFAWPPQTITSKILASSQIHLYNTWIGLLCQLHIWMPEYPDIKFLTHRQIKLGLWRSCDQMPIPWWDSVHAKGLGCHLLSQILPQVIRNTCPPPMNSWAGWFDPTMTFQTKMEMWSESLNQHACQSIFFSWSLNADFILELSSVC